MAIAILLVMFSKSILNPVDLHKNDKKSDDEAKIRYEKIELYTAHRAAVL